MLLENIKSFLISAGIVEGDTGWKIKLTFQPDTPDKIVTLYDLPGFEPQLTSDPDGTEAIYYPGFQVRVRGETYGAIGTTAKMREILLNLNGASISGSVYVIAQSSGPVPLGFDGNNRPEYTMSYKTMED